MVHKRASVLLAFIPTFAFFVYSLIAGAAPSRPWLEQGVDGTERLDDHVGSSWRGRPRVTVDGGGTVYAFWDDRRLWPQQSIYWNMRTDDWGAEMRFLSGSYAVVGPIAASFGGDLYVTFRDGDGTPRLQKRQANGVWGTVENIPNARLPDDIAVTSVGKVYLLFGPDMNGLVQLLSRETDGTWHAVETVNSETGAASGIPARLTIDANGTLFAVWNHRDEEGAETIYVSQRSVIGVWGDSQRVESLPEGYDLVGLDVEAGPNSIHVLSARCKDQSVCQVIYNRCTGVICEDGWIVTSTSGDYRLEQPRVVVDSEGDVYAAFWTYPTSTSVPRLYLTRRFTNGVWSPLVELDDSEGGDSQPDLALGGGNISVVWNSWLGDDDGHAIWSHTWQQGFLPGQVADLTITSDDIQVGQLYQEGGLFYLPLTVTVRNEGKGAAYGVQVEFRHGIPGQPAPVVAEIAGIAVAAEDSAVLTYDWDVSQIMGRLDLIVTLDPDDEVVELDEGNNQATISTLADASPRLTAVKGSFKPGMFLQGVSLDNTFSVKADWNGDLPGLGAVGGLTVTFELNGDRSEVTVASPDVWAEHKFNMGALSKGSNLLRLTATNGEGRSSRITVVELFGVAAPAWLTGNTSVVAEPPDAVFDKVAVYQVDADWQTTPLDARLQVPEAHVPAMPGLFGSLLQPWSLQLDFRSDGSVGSLGGQGELWGYLADQRLIPDDSAQPASAAGLDIEGSVELGSGVDSGAGGHTLSLNTLNGTLQTTATQRTPRIHLITTSLPFWAQNSLTLDVSADLSVMERDDGQLGWVTQTLELDAGIQGVAVAGGERLGHLDGGIGGQPWHKLGLTPGGVFTKSYAANLYAWARERFFIWDKTWEMTYTHALTDQPGMVRVTGPTLALDTELERQPDSLDALPTDIYAYADPALAYRSDDDMTLVYVSRIGLIELNLTAYKWDGTSWTKTGFGTDGLYINAQPSVAYAGVLPLLVWTRVVTPVSDSSVGPRAILAQTEIAASFLGELQPPVAAFHSSSPDVIGETTLFFNDTQLGVPPETTYEWDFGDNSPHSTLETPSHSYSDTVSYTVFLTATNAYGSSVVTGTVDITCDAPTGVGFDYVPANPVTDQVITFTGVSAAAPTPTFTWSFGDSSLVAVGNPVAHSYPVSDTYTAWMTASNYCGSDSVSRTLSVISDTTSLALREQPLVRVSPSTSPAENRTELDGTDLAEQINRPEEMVQIWSASRTTSRHVASGDWTTMTLVTNNTVMDLLPAVQSNAAGSNDVLLMWLRDDSGNYALFSDETTGTLTVTVMAARWNGIEWSEPVVALDGVRTRQVPQFAYRGQETILTWSHDRDANPTTITDTEIHVASWISPTNWTTPTDWIPPAINIVFDDGGALADLSPRVVFDSQGRATVVWLRMNPGQSEQLWYAVFDHSTLTGLPKAAFGVDGIADLELLVTPDDDLIALWRGLSESGLDLWYSIFDRDFDLWSVPKQLTDDDTVEGDYGAVVNSSGQAVVLYAGRQVMESYRTVGGERVAYPDLDDSADLTQAVSAAATMRDLAVENLVVAPSNPSPGSEATFTGTIVNNGSLTVDPAYVIFRDGGDPISSLSDAGPLAAGAREIVTTSYTVLDTGAAHTFHLMVDPEDIISETNEANNIITLTTVLADLQVSWWATDFSIDTITVTVGVTNAGVIAAPAPFSVELRTGSETGLSYASTQVGADLPAGSETIAEMVFKDVSAVPFNALSSFVMVDAGGAVTEADELNNTVLVDVPRRPDLTVGPYDLTGAPTQRLTVHNHGPVAATNVLVTVYQGAPGANPLFQTTIASLSPDAVAELPVWGPHGELSLFVHVDPADGLAEADESNNRLERTITLWPRVFLPLVLREQ